MKQGVTIINTSRGGLMTPRPWWKDSRAARSAASAWMCSRARASTFTRIALAVSSPMRLCSSLHVPQRDHHRPPSFLHQGGSGQHWPHHNDQHQGVRCQGATGERGQVKYAVTTKSTVSLVKANCSLLD
ncbi:hypothetical protein GQ600_23007 [Phytophthora cactorum]|nr:hypothetical protein GQ600_23007 [Phytophthora cactorum]